MKKVLFVFLVAFVVIGSPLFAQAAPEKFPSRPVTIIVQANPGGSSDLNCRTIAPGMQEVLGVPVTVENRPGAGGGIALTYGSEVPADGYVITHLPVELSQLKAAGLANVTPNDFRLLARTAYHPATIAVRADSKYKTFEDFVADMKARPGQVTVGNSGIGAAWHLAASRLEQAVGGKLNHIPFEGAGPSITALMGGHIDATCASAAEVQAQVKSGDLRLLIILSDDRFELFPEVPTSKDYGLDASTLVWIGFGVPKDTPDDVFNILLDAMRKSYNTDFYQNTMLKANGYSPGWMEPAEFTQYAREQYEVYRKLIPTVMGYAEVPPLD